MIQLICQKDFFPSFLLFFAIFQFEIEWGLMAQEEEEDFCSPQKN